MRSRLRSEAPSRQAGSDSLAALASFDFPRLHLPVLLERPKPSLSGKPRSARTCVCQISNRALCDRASRKAFRQTGACAMGRPDLGWCWFDGKSPVKWRRSCFVHGFQAFWYRRTVPLSCFPRLLIFGVRKAAQNAGRLYIRCDPCQFGRLFLSDRRRQEKAGEGRKGRKGRKGREDVVRGGK